MKNYFIETWWNLKNLVAFKNWYWNIKHYTLQTLQNELSPSSWLNPDHHLHAANMVAESKGWVFQHIPIGAIAYVILTDKGVGWWQSLLWIAGGAFVVEVIQFFVARASFINPINSALDIWFYVLGGILAIGILN